MIKLPVYNLFEKCLQLKNLTENVKIINREQAIGFEFQRL